MIIQRFLLCRSRARKHRFYPWYAVWVGPIPLYGYDLDRVEGLWTRTQEGLVEALKARYEDAQ